MKSPSLYYFTVFVFAFSLIQGKSPYAQAASAERQNNTSEKSENSIWQLQQNPNYITLGPGSLDEEAFRVHLKQVAKNYQQTALTWKLDAKPYRGKRISLSTKFKTNEARVRFHLQVNRSNKQPEYMKSLPHKPITSPQWSVFEKSLGITSDADEISVKLVFFGNNDKAQAWLQDVSIEVMGPSGEGDNPPQALSSQELRNLRTYAKALSYLRYFHPSNAAAYTDWDTFTIQHLPDIEKAQNTQILSKKLTEAFQPLITGLQIYTGVTPPISTYEKPTSRYLFWQHYGLGAGEPDKFSYFQERLVYSSNDQVLLSGNQKFKGPGLEPSQVYTTEIGQGLYLRFPLSIYTESFKTDPIDIRLSQPQLPTKPLKWSPSGNDRESRLAAILLAWGALKHFYPYFDVVKTDWDQVLSDTLSEAAIAPDARAFHIILEKFIEHLHDGHGQVYSPYETRGRLKLHWHRVKNVLVVTQVHHSIQEQLTPGDVVLSVNGIDTAQALKKQEDLTSGSDQWKYIQASKKLLRQPLAQPVLLKVRQKSGSIKEITTYSDLDLPFFEKPALSTPQQLTEMSPGIFYVNLSESTSPLSFQQVLEQLSQAKGVIFDLREYPNYLAFQMMSHLTEVPLKTPQFRIPIYLFPDQKQVMYDTSVEFSIPPKKPYLAATRVFLVNGQVYSFGETLTAMITHHKLGETIGSRTAGANGNVKIFPLPGDYVLNWTGMQVLTHTGQQHHNLGIEPNQTVLPTQEGLIKGQDELLERALEVLSEENQH